MPSSHRARLMPQRAVRTPPRNPPSDGRHFPHGDGGHPELGAGKAQVPPEGAHHGPQKGVPGLVGQDEDDDGPHVGMAHQALHRLLDLAEALAGLRPGHFGPGQMKGAEGDDGEGQGRHDDGHPHEGGAPAHQVAEDQHPAPGGDEAHPVGADADAVGHAQFLGIQQIDGVGVHRQVLGGRGQAQDPHQDPKGQG